jgi:hypothetical protein
MKTINSINQKYLNPIRYHELSKDLKKLYEEISTCDINLDELPSHLQCDYFIYKKFYVLNETKINK